MIAMATPVQISLTPEGPIKAKNIHARLLRLALGVEESRAYWENVDPSVTPERRAGQAFEQRWFGAKSLERVRFIVANFVDRYDTFPAALAVLRRWRSMDTQTRQAICHVHLQLSDPIYRAFTGYFLVERRALPEPRIDRDVVLRWVKTTFPDRWSEATCVQFASKLLSATSEAGLISAKRDPRALLFPKVPDVALAYILHLLRETRIEGTLIENPYLASLGLVDAFLDQRLSKLPGIEFHRMGRLFEFEWAQPTITDWAEATL